jgi:hypothetical protein
MPAHRTLTSSCINARREPNPLGSAPTLKHRQSGQSLRLACIGSVGLINMGPASRCQHNGISIATGFTFEVAPNLKCEISVVDTAFNETSGTKG